MEFPIFSNDSARQFRSTVFFFTSCIFVLRLHSFRLVFADLHREEKQQFWIETMLVYLDFSKKKKKKT